jgi:uncharacterized protein YeaO (DUF488 family)
MEAANGRRAAAQVGVKIDLKRVYEEPAQSDGVRILVDRLWPRGLTKEAAKIDYWAKGVSPSNELRRWYGHDPDKWPEFRRRYFSELDQNPDAVAELRQHLKGQRVTFLYSSKEDRLNNAVALKDYLDNKR